LWTIGGAEFKEKVTRDCGLARKRRKTTEEAASPRNVTIFRGWTGGWVSVGVCFTTFETGTGPDASRSKSIVKKVMSG